MEESKKDKFKRLAENRTNKILQTLVLLGNLSNKSAYEYDDKEVEKIFNAIQAQVNESKKRFSMNGSAKSKRFTLD